MFEYTSKKYARSQGEEILKLFNIPNDVYIRMKDLISSDMITTIRSKFKAQ